MEDLIGLLIVVAAMIFKVVSNRLDKAGKQAGKKDPETPASGSFDVKEWINEVLEEIEDEKKDTVFKTFAEPAAPAAPAAPAVPVTPVVRKPAFEENMVRQTDPKPAARSVQKKPILEEAVQEQNKEKIDPKKLVIYSEIMKPKYLE